MYTSHSAILDSLSVVPPVSNANLLPTCTGMMVDPFRPARASLDRRWIAQGLSHKCRYQGQTRFFYSVAEHAVLLSRWAEEMGLPVEAQWLFLHHDDTEALLPDIPSHIKPHVSIYLDGVGNIGWSEAEDHL